MKHKVRACTQLLYSLLSVDTTLCRHEQAFVDCVKDCEDPFGEERFVI
jgi:hypothetical protein